MDLVILGAPASGKGTQSKKIRERFEVVQMSTGDLLRENVKNGTSLGNQAKAFMEKGDLVPDELINTMVKERLLEPDCAKGVLFDGYPRTLNQAQMLDGLMGSLGRKIVGAISINVPDEVVIDRMTGRRTCEKCGGSFHLVFIPPKINGKCDNCGSQLIQRSDDNVESVRNRLKVFLENVDPIKAYYKGSERLKEVDGNVAEDAVFNEIVKYVDVY